MVVRMVPPGRVCSIHSRDGPYCAGGDDPVVRAALRGAPEAVARQERGLEVEPAEGVAGALGDDCVVLDRGDLIFPKTPREQGR